MQARSIVLTCLILESALASRVAHAQEAAPVNPVDPLLAEAIQWYTGVAGTVDDERAADLLLQAVEDEDPISVMWLARVHSTGRMGFEQDTARARTLAAGVIDEVRAFAGQGLVEAQFLMGTAYAESLGVEQNALEAMTWYLRAATSKHVLAQHNLGNVYFQGAGVEQSDSLAVIWWRQAAEQGDAIPALRLGTMYEEGRGVAADLDEARRWYEEAASRGNADAAEALARMGAR